MRQFANKRRTKKEEAACLDLLQFADYLRLAPAPARFGKLKSLAVNRRVVGSSPTWGAITYNLTHPELSEAKAEKQAFPGFGYGKLGGGGFCFKPLYEITY